MIQYLLIGWLATAAGLGTYAWWQSGTVDDLRERNAALQISLQEVERARQQAREAAEVAKAVAERQEAKAAEYDALREALLREGNDGELPDWMRDYLRNFVPVSLRTTDAD